MPRRISRGGYLFASCLRENQRYSVAFNLRIQRGVLNTKQSGRTRLVTTGADQGGANEISFKPPHFVVKLHFVVAVFGRGVLQTVDDVEEFHRDISKGTKPAFKCFVTQDIDGLARR